MIDANGPCVVDGTASGDARHAGWVPIGAKHQDNMRYSSLFFRTPMLPKHFTKKVLVFILGLGLVSCQGPLLPKGDPDNGGLILPEGFEAVVVADSLGKARHLAVNDNGDVYLKMRYADEEGENVALRDTDSDGRADIVQRFGLYGNVGSYGTAMRIYQGYLYFSTAGRVMRHKLTPGKLIPEDEGEVIMIDDYKNAEHGYEHIAKPITFDQDGHLYVPFGAPGDVCQAENRKPGAPGQDPCPQLEWHGGIWQFDANKPNQRQKDGYRYATGIRSIVAMDWNHADNNLYVLQHGRDNLSRTWRRRNPFRLCHDRAGRRIFRRHQHSVAHRTRRRSICAQRSQVVDLRRRRPSL